MKKIVVLISISVLSVSVSFAQKAQKSANKNKVVADSAAVYHCSMKCLKDKHYTKVGKCEMCGMKLVKDTKK